MIDFTLEELLRAACRKSCITDGHFTVFKFTSHWKIFSGTPDLDSGAAREEVCGLKGFDTLEEALKDYLLG